MDQLSDLAADLRVEPSALLDIFLTAVLIYLVLRLIQGTRAVRLAIGATIVYAVYVVALELDLRLLSGILQTGAVVGLVALVVVFQPELRRALDRLGRVGSWAWLGGVGHAAATSASPTLLAASAAKLSRRRTGALIVVERDTGLGDMAETGVIMNAELSAELLASLFAPGYPLHDGAVIVSGDEIVAAGVMLPLAEREGSLEQLRHPPPCRARGHRADRRAGHRGQRGERRHQPGPGRYHRARARRGRAAPAPLRPARPGRRGRPRPPRRCVRDRRCTEPTRGDGAPTARERRTRR